MRFLLLLLPNLYDIFTLIMIGYAFFLNHNSQLQIPFVTACLLIYATTRVGIFAGKIVNLMAGKSNVDQQNLEEPQDVIVKKMILGIIPQCIFIIVCQIIFAICFLQNPAAAQFINPANLKNNNVEENILPNINEDPIPEKITEELNNNDNDEEKITPSADNKTSVATPVKTTNKVKRISTSQKKVKTESQPQQAAQNNVYYEIPDKTLRSAGISPAARKSAYSQNANQSNNSVIPTNNNSGNWSFSATNSTVTRVAQNLSNNETSKLNNQTSTSSLQPKRYPGDDNPLNTNWGYYKHTDKPVSQTKNSSNQQQRTNNIPAKTLRSIGY